MSEIYEVAGTMSCTKVVIPPTLPQLLKIPQEVNTKKKTITGTQE